MNYSVLGIVFFLVFVVCVVAYVSRFAVWYGKRAPNVVASDGLGTRALLLQHSPRATNANDVKAEANAPPLELSMQTSMPPYSAVYNTSCAYTSGGAQGVWGSTSAPPQLVTASRISTYTFCPGANILQHWDRQQDAVAITIGGRAYEVVVPSEWIDESAATAWSASGGSGEWESVAGTIPVQEKIKCMRDCGLEDPRVLELTPGTLGIVVSLQSRSQHYIRVALLVLQAPLSGDARAAALPIEPEALILMPARGGNTKNWMARVHNDRVYFITHVHPQTIVSLALHDVCNAKRLVVLEPRVDVERVSRLDVPPVWRGNSVLVPYSSASASASTSTSTSALDSSTGLLISIVHQKHSNPMQWGRWGVKAWGAVFEHAFALFDAAPPFALRAVSRSFQILPQMPYGASAQFVFCTGLAPIPFDPFNHFDDKHFLVTFGVDDCYEASCVFSVDEIDALFDSSSKTLVEKHVPIFDFVKSN